MENLIVEYSQKIQKQIFDIKKLSTEDNYFKLDDYVKSILNLISELSDLLKDEIEKRKYDNIWKNLDYTLNREVKYAKIAYNKARAKNAPRIRESEYRSKLLDAIKQVELELTSFRNQ